MNTQNSYPRLKMWLDFIKWFIVSVAFVLMTKIIDSGFRDREIGINELKEYSRYTELVTDYHKISERKLLAEFFSNITPSDKLREGWKRYYVVVKREFDSISKEKAILNQKLEKAIIESDSLDLIQSEKIIILENKIEELNKQLTPKFSKAKENNSENKIMHIIRPSESLEHIAEKYDIPFLEFMKLNPQLVGMDSLRKNYRVGKKVRIK